MQAQQPDDYVLHATTIYRITRCIDWPLVSGGIVKEIVSMPHTKDELQILIAGKKAQNQTIIISHLPSSFAFFNCHLLCEYESFHFKKTVHSLIHIVTEAEGAFSNMKFLLKTQTHLVQHGI